MKKFIALLLFFPIICFADDLVQVISALEGGINFNNMNACQTMLDQKCRRKDTPFIAYDDNCVRVLFKNESDVCQQNAVILQALGFDNVTYYKSFGNIDLLHVNHPADGLQSTYLVSRKGQLISLVSDLQLLKPELLQQLQTKNPKISLSNIAFGNVLYQNDPVKGAETVTLQQFLLSDGTMASHNEQCYASVDYQFNTNGTFVSVLPITKSEC